MMKKLTCFILALVFPLLVFAETSPSESTLTTYRVWVKDGHTAAFEKALAEHAKKFHTGHWKWRVYQVMSGPDGGSYQISEGPNSWTTLDGRGNLSAEHGKHYETVVLPHVQKSSPDSFMTYDDKLSTTGVANWSTKAVVTHVYLKPGRVQAYAAALKTNKAVWEKLGGSVVVWRSYASGPAQFAIVRRLKNGFKDFDSDPAMYSAEYDAINGAGSYDKYLEEVARDVDSSSGDMIEFKPELSSAN
jgi:hypothetical protein